jgi:hypothetical protein
MAYATSEQLLSMFWTELEASGNLQMLQQKFLEVGKRENFTIIKLVEHISTQLDGTFGWLLSPCDNIHEVVPWASVELKRALINVNQVTCHALYDGIIGTIIASIIDQAFQQE